MINLLKKHSVKSTLFVSFINANGYYRSVRSQETVTNNKYTSLLSIRMEKLDCRSTSTLIKSVGTVVSIAGAFTATLYKGPQILLTSSSLKPQNYLHFQETDWVIGGLYLVVDCIAVSAYLIVQV